MDSYIVLFRGDDSDFTGNQEIIIELQTTLDLTGCQAHFKFLDFKQDFSTIPADKKLHLVFPASATKLFPLGAMDAEIWLTDSTGKRRTIANRVHVVVTQSVKDVYDPTDPQCISVVITNTVRIFTNADVFDMECSDWQFRKALAKVWTAIGGKVENND